MLTVKPIKSESSSALRKLMRDISVPQDALKSLETASWDNLKNYFQRTKLPITAVHLWTDSLDVLFWLRKPPQSWKVFVANRCSEIINNGLNAHHHYVKFREKPADIVSRGCPTKDLIDETLWWHGPKFLRDSNLLWSTAPHEKVEAEIKKKTKSSEAKTKCGRH